MGQIICDLRRKQRAVLVKPDGDPVALHHHGGRMEAPRGSALEGLRHHVAPKTLVCNAFRQGFYWPTAITDTIELVRSCHGCEFYAKQT